MPIPFGVKPYRPEIKDVAMQLIKDSRGIVKIEGKEIEFGMRFNDDAYVFSKLELMTTEKDFAHDPIGTITAALTDAAAADWWYSTEKDYGCDDRECDEFDCEVEE